MTDQIKGLVATQLGNAMAARDLVELDPEWDTYSDDMKQWKRDRARMEEETWEWCAKFQENLERKSRRADRIDEALFFGLPLLIIVGMMIAVVISK